MTIQGTEYFENYLVEFGYRQHFNNFQFSCAIAGSEKARAWRETTLWQGSCWVGAPRRIDSHGVTYVARVSEATLADTRRGAICECRAIIPAWLEGRSLAEPVVPELETIRTVCID